MLCARCNYGRKESIIILIILELRISLPLLRAAQGRWGGGPAEKRMGT